tara:strand:+ start:2286 stop:4805 length:2520 start_codon:yes stop_codon:yes gene_type:complete
VGDEQQQAMRSSGVVAMLLIMLMMPPTALADSGRAAPSCTETTAAQFSSSDAIADGTCVKVSLGVLMPGDVFDININIIEDAMDVLVFDQNTIQPYDLGQSYRSSYEQIPSTESALGSFSFHWKVPASISQKTWYIVFDNLDHDGDQGMGDLGGNDSRASLSVEPITEGYWTPFHDLIAMEPDEYQTLLSGDDLVLDAGTTIVVSAWSLEGQGDVYLQTQSMNALYTSGGVGTLSITGGSLQSVQGSSSFTWIVPNELDGEALVIVADNTDTPVGGANGQDPVRMTVRVELAPTLNPTINSNSNGTTTIGATVSFDAMSTPNRLNQIESALWDFDALVDADDDGTANNDADGTGWDAQASWSTPGERTVTLWVTSPTGQMASTTTMVDVQDVTNPVARIGGDGQPIAGGWRLLVNTPLSLNCDASGDDHEVSLCSWNLDGSPYGQNSTILLSWPSIGAHDVSLTVTDASGNTNTSVTTVVVVDNTLPVLQQSSLNVLPASGMIDQAITCSVSANDPFDETLALRYHWDLNPELDSDGNGDERDDPDRIGSRADLTFKEAGTYTVVVTVFDPSNNSDSHAFTIKVGEPTEEGSIAGLLLMVLFIGTLTMGIALVGHRRWQHGVAVELLIGRGLSAPEAKVHIAQVIDSRKTPLFAPAIVLAGLDVGDVTPTSVKEEEAKAAEIESIYGGGQMAQPSSAFAPPTASPSFSAGSQAAAADAMALLNDEAPLEQPASVQTKPDFADDLMPAEAPQTVVKSGGVQLPQGMAVPAPIQDEHDGGGAESTPAPTTAPTPALVPEIKPATSLTCQACNAPFSVTLPDGIEQAVVACPACGTDNIVNA